jgi:hypothetical protein
MSTQADSSASELRRSLDSAPEPSDNKPEHPSLTYLRSHAMRCERCATGTDCAMGESLLKTWLAVRARIEAVEE